MKFRKKPVVKEGTPGSLYPVEEGSAAGTLLINTLEGQLLVSWGDWIIRSLKAELYACKPDIFLQTYEAYTIENKEIK